MKKKQKLAFIIHSVDDFENFRNYFFTNFLKFYFSSRISKSNSFSEILIKCKLNGKGVWVK